jgi:hypothetical protein
MAAASAAALDAGRLGNVCRVRFSIHLNTAVRHPCATGVLICTTPRLTME